MTQMGAIQRIAAVAASPLVEIMDQRKRSDLSHCHPAMAKVLLYAIANHAGGDTGTCFAKQCTLMLETGLAETTLRKVQRVLEDMGILSVDRRSVTKGHVKKRGRSPRQLDVLSMIIEYREGHVVSPTMREMAQVLGMSGPGVFYHISELRRRGLLKGPTDAARGCYPTEAGMRWNRTHSDGRLTGT